MQWVKQNKHKLLVLLFVSLYLLTRIPRLGNDEINPDAVNWYFRSQQFIVGLKTGQLEKTYQHYHPGVTLMWATGVPVEVYKQISNISLINHQNFETFHWISKVSIVAVQLVLTLLILFNLSKILGFEKSIIATSIFTFEPFFLANSRIYHMDAMLTLFVFLTLIYLFRYLNEHKLSLLVLTGIFATLSFLTKSVAIGTLVFGLIAIVYYDPVVRREKFTKPLIFALAFVLSTYLFFPALWKFDLTPIKDIFNDAINIGVEEGHQQIIFGNYSLFTPWWFYVLIFVLKSSPLIILGSLTVLLFGIRDLVNNKKVNLRDPNLIFLTTVFYLGYLIVISISNKKLDRYFIVLYPYLALLTTITVYKIIETFSDLKNFRTKFYIAIGCFVLFSNVIPTITYFPYYFTYSNPAFGRPTNANSIIGQKTFGMGIFDLRDYILSNYGDYPTLAMMDPKPISQIYPNSKLKHIVIDGVNSSEIVVLGINDEKIISENSDSRIDDLYANFQKEGSIEINGLEYWEIYVKKK